MLCVCQYSEDGQWYRSQVKGQKLVHLHVCVHTLLYFATVAMVTFRREKQQCPCKLCGLWELGDSDQ